MTKTHSSSIILAAMLFAVPAAGAMAQSNPTGNLGSNKSVTAGPSTADNKVASKMDSADANAQTPHAPAVARNSNMPGATGRTVVPGSTSTMNGAKGGTSEQKTGSLSK